MLKVVVVMFWCAIFFVGHEAGYLPTLFWMAAL